MFLADFHIHSTFSDGEMTISQIVDFYGKREFGAIAITDHICEESSFLGIAAHLLCKTLTRSKYPDYIATIKSESNRAWNEYQMLVLPGFELSKNYILNRRSAHVLAIGIDQFIPADGDLYELIKTCHNLGALTVAAHPVSTRVWEKQTLHLWDKREKLSSILDAWEVASGPILFPEVLSSGLPMIATSDLHRPKQINSWKSVFHCRRDKESIFSAIRDHQVGFHFYHERSDRRILSKIRSAKTYLTTIPKEQFLLTSSQ